MEQSDVVIAGGGLGGLFTGALLARNGLVVTVLEKNSIPGGGLQSFRRGGVSFDTGMHVMGGWRPGGTLDRITRYLGIRDRLDIASINDDCMDSVTSLADGVTYRIPAGRDAFIDGMSGYFPDQRRGLEDYMSAIDRIAGSFDLFNLRPYTHAPSFDLLPESVIPADEFIAHYISDSRLCTLLAYNNGLYNGVAGRTPAYVHALITSLYLKGASRFVGNSFQLARELIGVIESAGGSVLCNHEVESVRTDDSRHIISFSTVGGDDFRASRFVWAAHPAELLRIVPAGLFNKAYVRRVTGVRPTCSAFSIFIEFKPASFGYIDHTCYIHDNLVNAWNLDAVDSQGIPSGFMYMTPPVYGQGQYSGTMLITALMDYAMVERWNDGRDPEYYEWKQAVADGIIAKIECRHPGFTDCIASMYTASPLTIRDYCHSPRGSIYGFSKDCRNLLESQLPVVTKSPNLFLTGQCVNLHGICGVPLTALTTAEAILYPGTILSRL